MLFVYKGNLILYIIIICIDKRDVVLKISNFLIFSFEI